MTLDEGAARILRALRAADGATFAELVRIAGLNPARDLRGADLAGVDFAGCDLSGYDFSGARLTGASFVGARIERSKFDRADTDGVSWPSEWRQRMDSHVDRAPLPLAFRQQEIADVLVAALRAPPARALAILPPGIGKSRILAEVFRDLSDKKRFRRGLILCESIAERDQLISVLRERGVATADAKLARDKGVIRPGTTLVETFGNHNRLRKELEQTQEDWSNPLRSTHVALTALPTRRRSAIANIANASDAPAIVAFVEASADSGRERERLERGQLGRVFDDVVYEYRIEQAVADGALTVAEVIDRSHAVAPFSESGQPHAGTRAVLEEVASDFEMELGVAPRPTVALLLTPDVDDAELLADDLRTQMRLAAGGRGEPIPVSVLGRRARREEWLSASTERGIFLAAPEVVDRLSLGDFGLVGVLTGIPDRLATRLRFPPSTQGGGRRPRVLDYVGKLAARQNDPAGR